MNFIRLSISIFVLTPLLSFGSLQKFKSPVTRLTSRGLSLHTQAKQLSTLNIPFLAGASIGIALIAGYAKYDALKTGKLLERLKRYELEDQLKSTEKDLQAAQQKVVDLRADRALHSAYHDKMVQDMIKSAAE